MSVLTVLLLLIISLLVWTCTSIWWFVQHMGDKSGIEKWYDVVMLAPVFSIVWIAEKVHKR